MRGVKPHYKNHSIKTLNTIQVDRVGLYEILGTLNFQVYNTQFICEGSAINTSKKDL